MPLFQFSLTVFNGVVRIVNSKYLLNISHKKRIFITLCFMGLGLFLIAVSNLIKKEFGFYIALLGSLTSGIASALGEGTILGYLKEFPPILVSGWYFFFK